MTQQYFKAAIFDLDGVIADTARFHFLAWQSIADDEGFSLPAVVDDRVKGVDRMASLNIVLEYAGRTYSDAEKEALAAQKNERYVKLIAGLTPADLLPGAQLLLDRLRVDGIGIGLASASRNALPVLKALGIFEHFNTIADANYISHPKPHPEIFLTAADGLGVSPADCLGFEDAEAGITAIKAAGMTAVGVGSAELLREADDIVSDLTAFDYDRYFRTLI
ncbi:beta-phosphoglucomutase [Natronospirillum operosum]|uniref:Beta-phosphoglucomutase n=1 Tax=Natronospirillum operosum TaxID=2759953 RepID=A0A4Z0WAB4_9GAMM|nr:beta-phosphoglucomutase [Natronospirillum operosum]TGG95092.1 beta-phosphoglucomutase [Natronospirillum operosum]